MSSAFAASRARWAAIPATAAVILVATVTACNPVQVRTTVSPDAHLAGMRTFVIASAASKKASSTSVDNDPMLANSITNRALRQDLLADFTARGYAVDSASPSFVVAYYATARQKLDVTNWDYGYPFWGYRGWWRGYAGYPAQQVQEYTEGTVIVDVIDAVSRQLLWRGQGKANVSDDPTTYATELARTVREIVAKFPTPDAAITQGS
jgi:hypothetical protein